MNLKFIADRDKMYPYPFYIADLALMLDMEPLAGQNLTMSLNILEKDRIYMHYDVDSIDAMGMALLDRLLKDDGFYEQVIDRIYRQSKEMESFTRKSDGLDVSKMSDNGLVDWYADYIRQTRALRAWGWVPVLVDGLDKPHLSNCISRKMHEYLKENASDSQMAEYFSLLSTSDSPSEVRQEELARLMLLAKMEDYTQYQEIKSQITKGEHQWLEAGFPEAWIHLQQHLKDYGWLTYGYSGPAMIIEHLMKALKSNLEAGSIQGQISMFHQRYEDIKNQKRDLLERLNLPADVIRLFEISAKFMSIKDFRKGVYQRSYLAMDKVMQEIAKRLELDLKAIKFMLFEEVKDALLNQRQAHYTPIVAQRLVKCCLIAQDGKFTIYHGQECEDQIVRWLGKAKDALDGKTVKTLKGSVAYVGHAKGVVRIVLVAEDVDKVNEGDILVSSSTNPDLIVAMKRAAAFVTDMGGITSHAAIVARELKKPCVVGTGKATRVLKDGDMVEVDAEKGLITITQHVSGNT
jgi:phosphohistidine swiveling domain-containing protein